MLEVLWERIYEIEGRPDSNRRGPLSTIHGIQASAGHRRAMEVEHYTLHARVRKIEGRAGLRGKYRP